MLTNHSIKRKLIASILATSAAVLALTCGTFLVYEFVTFRQTMVGNLSTLARVIAANSTAALAFDNSEDAGTVLSALAAEPHIVAAGLYDRSGALFAKFPATASDDVFPVHLDPDGYQFDRSHLVLRQEVVNANRRLGTVYLQSDLNAVYERLMVYAGLTVGVVALSCLVALSLSARLQRHITRPLSALVGAAAVVTEKQDYMVRAEKFSDDELGRLTDTFNGMLARIQEQDHSLRGRAEHLRREIAERTRAEAEIQALNAGLERRVQERTQALEEANKQLESFSYSVSHDLRAPLRAITGFSRILIDDYLPTLPAEAAGYLQRVANGGQQMGQLIDDLLEFSRLGRSPLRRVNVDPAEIARKVVDGLESDKQDREVNIVIGKLPACQADPSLLKQVYVNLVSNALKFTRHRKQASIEIGCQVPEAGAPIYFVKDNGAGFDMRYADKLFRVFQRLHRKEDYEGTGVGLAIVERVIARHGGRIWVEAAPDQGACFYFTIGASL